MKVSKVATLCRMAMAALEGDTSSWPPSPNFVIEAIREMTFEVDLSMRDSLAIALDMTTKIGEAKP